MTRRGFFGFLFVLFLFLTGCGKKETTPRLAEKPPVAPSPAPQLPPPEPKFAKIPEFKKSVPQSAPQSSPSSKQTIPSAQKAAESKVADVFLQGDVAVINHQVNAAIPLLWETANGKKDEVVIGFSDEQWNPRTIAMSMKSNPRTPETHLLMVNDAGQAVRGTATLNGISFFNRDGTPLLDSQQKPIQWKISRTELERLLTTKEGRQRLFAFALPVAVGALAVIVGVAILIPILIGLKILVALALWIALFVLAVLLAIPLTKRLLRNFSISDEQIQKFLEESKAFSTRVFKESLEELQKLRP